MNQMPLTLAIIIANVIMTIFGWNRHGVIDRFKFQVGPILYNKDYKRLITGNFLHLDVNHLAFNMLTLYCFGEFLEPLYRIYFGDAGPLAYLALYFGSMLGGDLLTLFLKRKYPHYSAIGASGAIAGIVFAYVILDPAGWIRLFFFIPMPNWLYGALYVLYSIYGIRRQLGNIGHDAHLGGAMAGMLLNFAFFYRISLQHWQFLLLLGIPTIVLIYLIEYQPSVLESPFKAIQKLFQRSPNTSSNTRTTSGSNPYNPPTKQDGLEVNRRALLQKELDALLDKVSRKGYNHLSDIERHRLDQLGKELGRNTNMDGGRAPHQ
jgi:membrane associated rhomboid family serine protease